MNHLCCVVANKIAHIEGLMCHTHDWCHSETGEGLKDTVRLGYQEKVTLFCVSIQRTNYFF
jgi:hypothetical protein